MPPFSSLLIDRTGAKTLATTDPATSTVYLSSELEGDTLKRVFLHELGHVVMLSYDLLDFLDGKTYPEERIAVEEWACNLIADFGDLIFKTAEKVLGDEAIHVVPIEIDRAIGYY